METRSRTRCYQVVCLVYGVSKWRGGGNTQNALRILQGSEDELAAFMGVFLRKWIVVMETVVYFK